MILFHRSAIVPHPNGDPYSEEELSLALKDASRTDPSRSLGIIAGTGNPPASAGRHYPHGLAVLDAGAGRRNRVGGRSIGASRGYEQTIWEVLVGAERIELQLAVGHGELSQLARCAVIALQQDFGVVLGLALTGAVPARRVTGGQSYKPLRNAWNVRADKVGLVLPLPGYEA